MTYPRFLSSTAPASGERSRARLVNPLKHNSALHGRDGNLRYGDVAKIAEEGARCGLWFAGAHTIEPGSRHWVLRLRAVDGTLYSIESWARWRALLDALKAAESSSRTSFAPRSPSSQ